MPQRLIDGAHIESAPTPLEELEDGMPPAIDSIPYELLVEIMRLTLILPRNPMHATSNPSPTEIMVLCSICSHWRCVALNNPRLWVEQEFPILFPQKPEMSLLVTQLFLERSAPLPVSVSPYSLIPPHLLPLMVSVVNRWRNFELLYHEDLPIEFVSALQMPPRNLKSLEKLYLTWPNPGSGVDTFKLTPCLRDVTLKGCWASSCIPLLPWSQFTRLSLEHESPQMCLDVIVQCTNLVSAHVVTDQWLEVPRIGETCVLEYVEKLEISMEICYEGQDLAPFLRALELPALKSLSLFIPFSRPPCSTVSFVPELILFLVQSPRLECLGLLDCVFAEDIQDILQHTPSLSELLFDQEYTASVGDDFFLALVYDAAAAAPLAPKLETLKLHNIGVDFTEEAFAQMIGSRWWSDDELNTMLIPPSVARLKRVNLNNDHFYPKYFTETFIEKMELYRSQGLNISY